MNIKPFLERHRGKFIWIPITLTLVIVLIWVGSKVVWTGFNTKTFWDWMELVLVPAVLGGGVIAYNYLTQKAERQRALDRQRQETLNIYFEQVQELLLKHNLHEKGTARSVARARTITAFKNLDGARIAQIVRLLTETGFGGKELDVFSFIRFNLQGADFSKANLQGAYFEDAKMQGVDLYHAELQKAHFEEANLQDAMLRYANMKGAILRDTKLQRANLSMTTLEEADLGGANLQGADLGGANLQGADLEGAILQQSKITPKQLDEVKSLKAATMPDGTKYEEWVAKGKPDWNK